MANAVFPNGIKTFTDKVDGVDDVLASDINEAYAEIIAMEGYLLEAESSTPAETTAPVISLPSAVVKGQFSEVVAKGWTYQNIASFGDCESTDGWSKTGSATLSTDNTNKFEGTNCLKLTLGATSGRAWQNILSLLDTSKYYLISVYLKNGNLSTGASLRVFDGTIYIKTSSVITSTSWTRVGIVLQPSDLVSALQLDLSIFIEGESGQYGYVDAIQINEITAAEYAKGANALLTEYNYVSPGNAKSTLGGRVTSVGKNLFDKNSVINSKTVRSDNGVVLDSVSYGYQPYRKIKPNTVFRATNFGDANQSGIAFYDANKNFISGISLTTIKSNPFTTPSNVDSYQISYRADTQDINTVQLEEGSTATAYEAYTDTKAYIPGPLRSLPNGVYDEFDVRTGRKTQNVEEHALESGDIVLLDTSQINVDIVYVGKPADFIYASTPMVKGSMTIEGFRFGTFSDDTSRIGVFFQSGTLTRVGLIVEKGLYASTGAARTALAGTTLIYQLATPVVTQHPPQALIACPNGQLIAEPGVIRFYAKPASGVITRPDATDTDKDIYSAESVRPVIDGVIGESIAPTSFDGTTLTNAAYDDDVMYEVVYHCDPAKTTIPTTRYSYPMDIGAAVNANTKGVAANSKTINDFMAYQNAVNLIFDLRITATES